MLFRSTWTNVQLTGDATIGGSQRFDIVRGTGSILNLNGYTLTKVGNNYSAIVSTAVSEGAFVVNGGTLSLSLSAVTLAVPGTSLVPAGVIPSDSFTVNNGGTLEIYGAPVIPTGWKYNLNDGSTLSVINTAATIGSNLTVTGTARLLANNSITVTGVIDGPGKVVYEGATGMAYTTTLSGANTYAGGSLVQGGASAVLFTVQANTPTAFGTGDVTIASNSGAHVTIAGGVSVANNFVLGTNQGPLQIEFGQDLGGRMLELFAKLQRPEVPEEGRSMEVRAFPVAWWTLGRTPQNDAMILTFEIQGGGHLGFQIPMDQAMRLTDAMNVAAKRAGGQN